VVKQAHKWVTMRGPIIKQNNELGGKPEPISLVNTDPVTPRDTRLKMVKKKEHFVVPNYNVLYDSLGTTEAWENSGDAYASGSITTVANGNAVSPVNISGKMVVPFKTNMWPGAVQVYVCIRSFAVAPRALPTNLGSVAFYYLDSTGISVPLGIGMSNTAFSSTPSVLIPSPLTDMPSNGVIGNIQATLTGTTPDTGTLDWQIGISFAYLLPAKKGYEVESFEHDQEVFLHEKSS
jgi:hypothetical protein